MSKTNGSIVLRWLLVLAMGAALGATAFAQSTVTGAIAGMVVDPSKAVVAGAKVTVRNLGTNVQLTATADAQGNFRVVELRPGTYSVTAEAERLSAAQARQVIVEVGRVTEVELQTAITGRAETAEVTAEAPLVNLQGQDLATNVNQTVISNDPVNNRRWSSYALLTPGVVPDGSYYLLSFRGISGIMNNSTVDGGDNNDAFWSEERGRTRAPYVVSSSAVQEFQVNTSDYSAEYGRAAGAVVNAVTKSGGNIIHGEGFYYDRNNAWSAMNPFVTENEPNPAGGYEKVPFLQQDTRQQFGGDVGGPIIKDKLFWFFDYDGQRRDFPLVATPSSATFLNAPTLANLQTVGQNLNLCTAKGSTACTTLVQPGTSAYVTSLAAYNNALAFENAQSGIVPRTGDQDVFLPKLDWVINSKNTFSASYNQQRWNSPGGIQTGANAADGTTSVGSDYVKTDLVNGRLTSVLTNNITNEFRYSWGRDFQFETPQTPNAVESGLTPYSPNLLSSVTGMVPDFSTGSGGLYGGTPDYLPRAAYPDETRNEFADSLSWVHGNHFFKMGFDFDRNNDLDNNLYLGTGYFSYSSFTSFASDLAVIDGIAGATSAGATADHWSYMEQAFGPPAIEYHTWDYAGFFQDTWKIAPHFTLNLGLRYDFEQLPSARYANPNFAPTQTLPSDKNNFGPRVGFAWDMFGDGKTILRGGYGMYYGRINNGAIESALFQTGAPGTQITYDITSPSVAGAPTFPNVLPSSGSFTGGTPSITYMSPHLQNPQIHEFDLILEREIAHNTVFSLSYMGSLGRELPNFIDTNLTPTTSTESFYIQGGPFAGQTYAIPFYTNASRPNTPDCYNGSAYVNCGAMVEMVSNVNSSYNALVARFTRRLTHGLQFDAFYTWSHAIDNGENSTQGSIPTSPTPYDSLHQGLEKSNSNLDVPSRFVASITYQPQYFAESGKLVKALLNGWNFAPVTTISSGLPYTESISGSVYTASGATISTPDGGINGAYGNRLAYLLGRNSFRYPMFSNVDMRISRKVKITERQSLEIMADVFNLANSLQVSGVSTTAYTTAKPSTNSASGGNTVLLYQNPSINPTASSTFGAVTGAATNLFQPRQFQVGLRYSF